MRPHICAERGPGTGALHPVMVVTCTTDAVGRIMRETHFPFGQNLKTATLKR